MHAYMSELVSQVNKGALNRREFLRYSTLLGLSAGGAAALAGLPGSARAARTTEAPLRGGELIVAMSVQKLKDPAAAVFNEFIIFRNVCEYLTVTNHDNITEPWLLEGWQASDDLKTWTLSLRKGIRFNHGPLLTADDVIFNFNRWLDPDTGSAMKGLLGGYLQKQNIEKVDDHTIRLHLDKPQIALPEHLNNHPAAILPRDFEGDWLAQPYGTGPFTLQEYIVDERVVLKARPDYWRKGADGRPLPYLDGIRFVALGSEVAMSMSALTGGQVHLSRVYPAFLDAFKGTPIQFSHKVSAGTQVIRMRADKAPFDNPKVRNAFKACQNRQQMLDNIMKGYGAPGEDHHVAPAHPEYCPGTPPPQDIDLAKRLLAEAGYPKGLTVHLAIMQDDPYPTMGQLLKANCAKAGITIELDVMPSSMYWNQWTEVDFGITSWAHRPLGVMVLNLAYRTGVPWNETHWSHPEFDRLLDQADATLDVDARRQIMCRLQAIMQEEGPVMIPYWNPYMWGHSPKLKNFEAASSDVALLYDVWLDPKA